MPSAAKRAYHKTPEYALRRCSGKVAYANADKARVIAWKRVHMPGNPTTLFVYACPFCGCFHLTKNAKMNMDPGKMKVSRGDQIMIGFKG